MKHDEIERARLGAIAEAGSASAAFWLALGRQDLLALEGLLEESGAAAWIGLLDPKSGRLPVEWAAFLHRHDSLRSLMAHGFPPGQAAGGRPPPLIQAVESHCAECLSILADSGADLEAEDAQGRTALVAAASLPRAKHSAKMVEALLARGADPDRLSSRGYFALGAAAANDKPVDIESLVEAKADVELHAGDGFTALFYAVDNNALAAAEKLLRSGADFEARADAEGASGAVRPLDLARLLGDSSMAALLYSFAEASALRRRLGAKAPEAPKRSAARL